MSTIVYYYDDEISEEKLGRGKYHIKQKGKIETKLQLKNLKKMRCADKRTIMKRILKSLGVGKYTGLI
jgi:hypothetical protein